jgi:hypothetical protein
MSERETVIEKVQKLLSLADEQGGGTEAERLNAAEKAQALILKHNLDTLELEAETDSGPEFVEEREDLDAQSDHWKGDLYSRLGKTVNVHVHYRRIYGQKSKRTYVLIGRVDSIAYVKSLAAYLVPYLETECAAELIKAKAGPERVCPTCHGQGYVGWDFANCKSCKGKGSKKIHARTFKTSFYDGAIWKIDERLKEQKAKQERESGNTSTALVRNDESALAEYVRDQHSGLRSARNTRSYDRGALNAGTNAGQNADLSGRAKVGRGRGALTA